MKSRFFALLTLSIGLLTTAHVALAMKCIRALGTCAKSIDNSQRLALNKPFLASDAIQRQALAYAQAMVHMPSDAKFIEELASTGKLNVYDGTAEKALLEDFQHNPSKAAVCHGKGGIFFRANIIKQLKPHLFNFILAHEIGHLAQQGGSTVIDPEDSLEKTLFKGEYYAQQYGTLALYKLKDIQTLTAAHTLFMPSKNSQPQLNTDPFTTGFADALATIAYKNPEDSRIQDLHKTLQPTVLGIVKPSWFKRFVLHDITEEKPLYI